MYRWGCLFCRSEAKISLIKVLALIPISWVVVHLLTSLSFSEASVPFRWWWWVSNSLHRPSRGRVVEIPEIPLKQKEISSLKTLAFYLSDGSCSEFVQKQNLSWSQSAAENVRKDWLFVYQYSECYLTLGAEEAMMVLITAGLGLFWWFRFRF